VQKTVTVIEDDKDLNHTIVKYLTMKGYKCKSIYDGKEAIDKLYEEPCEIVILDIKLPSCDGFKVAKEIRSFSDMPIIFLTSLDGQKDIERGFMSGGDDYLTKPFSLKELSLRIEAIYRRIYKNQHFITIDNHYCFDVTNLSLLKDGKEVHLKQKEAKLLMLFLQKRGEIVTKEEIFEKIYEYDKEPSEASLRTFVYKLRSLFSKDKILTIKDVGYRYVG